MCDSYKLQVVSSLRENLQSARNFPHAHFTLHQCLTRSQFQLSRREFLYFNLVFRDQNANSFLSVSCFEMRTRTSFFQFWASKRERKYRSKHSCDNKKNSCLSFFWHDYFINAVHLSSFLKMRLFFLFRYLNEN